MRQDRKAFTMLDIPDMPALAFRRRLGSLAPATLEGGGNPIEDLVSGAGDLVGDVVGGVGDLVGGVVDAVSDTLASVDDFVNDVIPGGWVTVGAAALIASGIYDPELLASAEEGTLTSKTLANAGYDAVEVANNVATVAPEVVQTTQAALSSGVTPEMIAMANATADPIAALNAAAGWTASDAAYLASIGYTGMIVNPATGAATTVEEELANQMATSNAPTSGPTVESNIPGPQFNAPTVGADSNIVAGTEVGQQIPGSYSVDANGTYYNVNGDPVAYTQANGGVVGADGVQYIQPTNTVPVQLGDGSVGAYDPTTGTVYNANGTVNTAATSGAPTAGPGTEFASAETPFRVDVSGTAGFEGNPTAVTGPITEGSQLATQAQIDAGVATYNPAANAWEVVGAPAELAPIVPAEIATGAGGSAYGIGGANYVAPVVADAAAAVVADAGLTATQVAALGGTAAAAAVVNSVGASQAAQVANQALTPPVETPTVVETPVVPTTTTPPVEYTGPGIGEPPPVVETPVVPVTTPPVVTSPATTTPPAEYTGPGIGEVPNPAEVPVTDLSTVAQPMGPSPYDWVAPAAIGAGAGALATGALAGGGGATQTGYGPLTINYPFGTARQLVDPGLNPGFVTAQPFYNTTSPVQAQYYWGAHPYTQTAADLPNRNNVPYAPAVPWGLQQAQAPFDVNQFIRTNITPQSQAAAAGTVPDYYAPYAATAYTGGNS